MDIQSEGSVARAEEGVIERAIGAALEHTQAVVVVSVEADGTLTYGFHVRDGAPFDTLMRLLCGTNGVMETLAKLLVTEGTKH